MSSETKPTTTALSVSTPAWTAGIYGQLDAARPVAELLAKSELVPKGFQGKPMDILIAGAMGHRLGLDLFSALAGIAVVNGRPTLWGDAQLAVCQSRPDWGGMKIDETGAGESFAVVVTITRKGHSEPYIGKFSMADAKRAGLAGKQGPWTQYPTRMCLLRARAFALRSAFADALAGFHAREEMDDEVDVTSTATVRAEPKPAKRRAIEATGSTVETTPTTDPAPPTQPAEDPKAEPATGGQDDGQVKTLGEHVADAQAKRDTSAEACVDSYAKLWNGGDPARALAKSIRSAWNLAQIADLGKDTEDNRAKFLDDIATAWKSLQKEGR